jgi:hypothetical protein
MRMGCEFELDLLPGLCRWGASLNWIYTRLEQEPYTTFTGERVTDLEIRPRIVAILLLDAPWQSDTEEQKVLLYARACV